MAACLPKPSARLSGGPSRGPSWSTSRTGRGCWVEAGGGPLPAAGVAESLCLHPSGREDGGVAVQVAREGPGQGPGVHRQTQAGQRLSLRSARSRKGGGPDGCLEGGGVVKKDTGSQFQDKAAGQRKPPARGLGSYFAPSPPLGRITTQVRVTRTSRRKQGFSSSSVRRA